MVDVGLGTHGVEVTSGLACSATGHCAHTEESKMQYLIRHFHKQLDVCTA